MTKAQQKKNRQKWIDALRSGKYKQGRGTLKDGDSFCCLGVLCDVYAKTRRYNGWDSHGTFFDKSFANNSDVDLITPVMDWVGMTNSGGTYYTKKGKGNSLMGLNDESKLSFKQIANVIEKEPDGLFQS